MQSLALPHIMRPAMTRLRRVVAGELSNWWGVGWEAEENFYRHGIYTNEKTTESQLLGWLMSWRWVVAAVLKPKVSWLIPLALTFQQESLPPSTLSFAPDEGLRSLWSPAPSSSNQSASSLPVMEWWFFDWIDPSDRQQAGFIPPSKASVSESGEKDLKEGP